MTFILPTFITSVKLKMKFNFVICPYDDFTLIRLFMNLLMMTKCTLSSKLFIASVG